MNLSQHFTLAEATVSQEASRRGIDNSNPSDATLANAIKTANMLERVRALLDAPITVNSWIRCPELNVALSSKSTSQHVRGEAVDFICPAFGSPLKICKKILEFKELIRFDQLILEHTWIHISWKADPAAKQRGEVLSLLQSGGYSLGLTDKKGVKL